MDRNSVDAERFVVSTKKELTLPIELAEDLNDIHKHEDLLKNRELLNKYTKYNETLKKAREELPKNLTFGKDVMFTSIFKGYGINNVTR